MLPQRKMNCNLSVNENLMTEAKYVTMPAMMTNERKTEYLSARRAWLEHFFCDLNPMQRQAVLATEEPVLILAGAGSGKTTVLIRRIVNLIRFGAAAARNAAKTATATDTNVFTFIYDILLFHKSCPPCLAKCASARKDGSIAVAEEQTVCRIARNVLPGVTEPLERLAERGALGTWHLHSNEHLAVVRAVVAVVEQRNVPPV